MSNQTQTNLSPESFALLIALAEDAGNWSGTPIVGVSQKGKGHLTDLKRKGYLNTFDDDGVMFADFTDKGMRTLAASGFADHYWCDAKAPEADEAASVSDALIGSLGEKVAALFEGHGADDILAMVAHNVRRSVPDFETAEDAANMVRMAANLIRRAIN